MVDHGFWDRVSAAAAIYEPMYVALRVLDTEVYPILGLVYATIQHMVEQIRKLRGTNWVVEIVKSR